MNLEKKFYFKILLLILLSFNFCISVFAKNVNKTKLNLKLTKNINEIPPQAPVLQIFVSTTRFDFFQLHSENF